MPTPIPIIQSWPLGSVDADGRLRWSSDFLDDGSPIITPVVRGVYANLQGS